MNPKKNWQVLSSYQHTRLRTEVYFGSRDCLTQDVIQYTESGAAIVETTWVPAVFTAFREILDNSLDECITHGHGNRIDVTFDADKMIFSVADNGRGIPIEWSDEHKKHAATVLLSEMNSGRNFEADRGETRGLNGIGAKGVNFCSEWFEVDITRNKQHFTQRFSEAEELQVEDPVITPVKTTKTGTKITCKLSRKVFHDLRLPLPFVQARMQEIAQCYPKLHLTFNGERVVHRNLFYNHKPIAFAASNEPLFTGKFMLVPNFVTSGEFAFSLVNAIPLFNGGSHIDAFRRGFYNGLLTALERESKKRKLVPNRADIGEGLLLYGILEMAAPSFDSQSKTRLINEQVGNIVRKLLDDPEFFKGVIKGHPDWIDSIFERCAKRTMAKDDKDAKKQAKKNLRQKIEDLEDACGFERSKCILFLTEGKSAVAGITEARDAAIHGALPLTGKILNTFGVSPRSVLANGALAKIMNAVGLVPGERANRYTLRYGRIFLATDADPDGANIMALLVNFFFTYWPELFDPEKAPFIYAFNTPLIIAKQGKKQKYWFSDNQQEFDAQQYRGWDITRAKGLAALTRDDWVHVLEKPNLQGIVDDGALAASLALLFDSTRADDRKSWMSI